MFERINKKVKGFFSSQRMKTLALMLLVGTTDRGTPVRLADDAPLGRWTRFVSVDT